MHQSRHEHKGRRGRVRGRSEGWGPRGGGPGGHRARRGDVRSAVLSLLTEKPMHGYEIIGTLEERSGGRWRPSAGSIYPTLQLLADEGLVKAEEVDGKRVFSLTDEGTKAAEAISDRRKEWEEAGEDSPFHRLRTAAFQVMGAARQVGAAGQEKQVDEVVKILEDARKKIYSILAEG
jgi:DNA-binding PadR family transcriptional regulator